MGQVKVCDSYIKQSSYRCVKNARSALHPRQRPYYNAGNAGAQTQTVFKAKTLFFATPSYTQDLGIEAEIL